MHVKSVLRIRSAQACIPIFGTRPLECYYVGMGARFKQFRKHIWSPFLRDMVNISLRKHFTHKQLQYTTTKLEICAPIMLCALRV